jgi:hypothetical protein
MLHTLSPIIRCWYNRLQYKWGSVPLHWAATVHITTHAGSCYIATAESPVSCQVNLRDLCGWQRDSWVGSLRAALMKLPFLILWTAPQLHIHQSNGSRTTGPLVAGAPSGVNLIHSHEWKEDRLWECTVSQSASYFAILDGGTVLCHIPEVISQY